MMYLNLGHIILFFYSLKMELRQTFNNIYNTLLMKINVNP